MCSCPGHMYYYSSVQEIPSETVARYTLVSSKPSGERNICDLDPRLTRAAAAQHELRFWPVVSFVYHGTRVLSRAWPYQISRNTGHKKEVLETTEVGRKPARSRKGDNFLFVSVVYWFAPGPVCRDTSPVFTAGGATRDAPYHTRYHTAALPQPRRSGQSTVKSKHLLPPSSR